MTRTIGIIPARGGSKGVPRKNIRLINNKPLISYTIEAALKSNCITKVVVSTDDEEIAGVVRHCGCEVIMRPPELAMDKSPMVPVALHVLDIFKNNSEHFDVVMLLQPTCPLRTAHHIDDSLQLFEKSDADAVIGVYRVWDEHPARMYRIVNDRLQAYSPDGERANRQELEPVFHRNGAIYGIKEAVLRAQKTFFPANSIPFIMDKSNSVNIDEEIDLLYAEFLMGNRHAENS